MKIIVGLGNPGIEYEKTRHNAGFIMLDKIKEVYKFPGFEFNNKFNAELSVGNAHVRSNEKIILAKPQAMMNNSGQVVKAVLDFYKLSPEDLIAVHDDIDIELGKYKISSDSGSAGHNGAQDIINKIGTQKFTRIRIGIANEKLRIQIDPTDFVLQRFSEEELTKIKKVSETAISEIKTLFKK